MCVIKHLEEIISIFEKYYCFFDLRNVNWTKIVQEARNSVDEDTTQKQLFKVVNKLISYIDDEHVWIDTPYGTAENSHPDRPKNKQALANKKKYGTWISGRGPYDNDDTIRYGVEENIGFLFVGDTEDELEDWLDSKSMAKAKKLFKNTKALVIDISDNGGGTDDTAIEFVSLFTKKKFLIFSKKEGNKDEPFRNRYVEPADELFYDGPIFLITSRRTISAAEIVVMGMKCLSNVKQIGEATSGSLSDILEKTLSNGWKLKTSYEVYFDSNKELWEGIGIQPDIDICLVNVASENNVETIKRIL